MSVISTTFFLKTFGVLSSFKPFINYLKLFSFLFSRVSKHVFFTCDEGRFFVCCSSTHLAYSGILSEILALLISFPSV